MSTERSDDREELQRYLEMIAARQKNGRIVHTVQMQVQAREVLMAHVIGTSPDERVYSNLAIDIGFHAGAEPYGEAIGIFKVTPHVGTVIAADIAVKSGAVDIGFMDRFKGALILTGPLVEVETAITAAWNYFHDDLGFTCRPMTKS